jgi:hypothetical protein
LNTLSGEISSLKPEVKKVKPNFIWENRAYDSYINNGFRLPTETPSLVPGYWENKFLSEVDLERGKIKVRVNTLIRQLAPDYSTENEEIKEYLAWNTSWFAQNYLGEKLAYHGHIAGVNQEQLKELVRSRDPKTYEEIAEYRHGGTRQTFYVPFTKKKVDEILSEHPFGADSVNITNIDRAVLRKIHIR